MKFDEIQNPKCDRCGTPNLHVYGAPVTDKGEVIEVYCDPCKDIETLATWDQDHRLHSRDTMTATLKTYRTDKTGVDPRWFEIADASARIHDHVKAHFEPSVWFGHAGGPFTTTPVEYGGRSCGFGKGQAMAKVVRASKNSWMVSGDVVETAGTYTVKTWCTAGRCLIEIESAVARITLITAEDEDTMRMGVQGIDATEAEAMDLLNRAEMAWLAGAFTLTDKKDTP